MSARQRTAASEAPVEDGLGQSVLMDVLWLLRFRWFRSRAIRWARPAEHEVTAWQGDGRLAGLGDGLQAVANFGPRHLWIIDRIWHGWPDPPEFAFVATNGDGTIWAAADFDRWPKRWTKQEMAT